MCNDHSKLSRNCFAQRAHTNSTALIYSQVRCDAVKHFPLCHSLISGAEHTYIYPSQYTNQYSDLMNLDYHVRFAIVGVVIFFVCVHVLSP